MGNSRNAACIENLGVRLHQDSNRDHDYHIHPFGLTQLSVDDTFGFMVHDVVPYANKVHRTVDLCLWDLQESRVGIPTQSY